MIIARKEKPKEGDLKIKKKFAWFPVWIGDKRIWLERYQRLYEWKVKKRADTPTIGKYVLPTVTGVWGEWELVGEKIGH